MPTTIRTSEPRELLSLIPYQLGFRPEESAVVVSLRGAQLRAGLVARVDLEDLVDPDHGPRVARTLAKHLVEDGARRAVLVVYTRKGSGEEGTTLARRALDHLEEAADDLVAPSDCWLVDRAGYRMLDCAEPGCCPPGGYRLSELESTQVSAGLVAVGVAVAGTRAELGRIPPAPAEARRAARRAAARWAVRARGARSTADLSRWRQEGLTIWRTELERALAEVGEPVAGGVVQGQGADRGPHRWQPPPATVLGRLRTALEDVLVRDAVLLSLVPGDRELPERVAAGDVGPDVAVALQVVLDPVRGRAPDVATAAAARALLAQVAAHVPRCAHAPSLTLLGVLAWWEGDGARAAVLLEQALAADADHRLALLVTQALDHGMPPGWLRHRPVDG